MHNMSAHPRSSTHRHRYASRTRCACFCELLLVMCVVLCCAVLCCDVLCFVVLCFVVLCCVVVLCCAVLCCVVLCFFCVCAVWLTSPHHQRCLEHTPDELETDTHQCDVRALTRGMVVHPLHTQRNSDTAAAQQNGSNTGGATQGQRACTRTPLQLRRHLQLHELCRVLPMHTTAVHISHT